MVYVKFQAITLEFEDTDLLLSSSSLEASLFRPLSPSLVFSLPRVPGDSNYPDGTLIQSAVPTQYSHVMQMLCTMEAIQIKGTTDCMNLAQHRQGDYK